MNLSKGTKIVRVMAAQDAGTSALQSDAVDMQGYDAVEFVTMLGAITSGDTTTVKASQSSDGSTFSDLVGTGISIPDTDSGKLVVLDIERPAKRYVRCEIERTGTGAVVDGVLAILYNGRTKPAGQDATVSAAAHHVSPEEGISAAAHYVSPEEGTA